MLETNGIIQNRSVCFSEQKKPANYAGFLVSIENLTSFFGPTLRTEHHMVFQLGTARNTKYI